jgi:hypothetical protein
MERFAKRHRQTLNELLGSDSGQSPSDSTLRLLLAQLVATGLVTLLRNWMAAQPGMAIAQTTYATDANSEIQALRQLLEAVALEGVLVLLFIKYITDQINKAINAPLALLNQHMADWQRSESGFSTGCPSFHLVDPPAGSQRDRGR